MAKARKLTDLTVTKVSLVPKGSNPDAHIFIYKNEEGQPVQKATFNEIREAEQKRQVLWKIYDSLYLMQEAIGSSLYSDNPDTEIRKSVKEFGAFVNELLDALEINKSDDDESVIKQQVQKKAEAIFARLFEKEPSMKNENPAPAETGAVEIDKSALPEAVRKALDAAEAQAADAIAKAKAATDQAEAIAKRLNEETEKRERAELVSVVKSELGNLPGVDADNAGLLFECRKALSAEAYAKLFEVLKGANAAYVATTKAEALTGDAPELVPGSPEETFEKRAREIMAAQNVTHPVALDKAFKENPGLYTKMRKAQREARR